jgi:amino acid adenylation domain-containing protein
MKAIDQFLVDLYRQDVQLWIDRDVSPVRLRCNAPDEVLTDELSVELQQRRSEIIAFLEQVNLTRPTPTAMIPTVDRDRPLPLSFAQQRLWFLEQLQPDTYTIPIAVRLTGQLNVEVLEQVFNQIVARHEILRTNFLVIDGEPIQSITADRPIQLKYIALQDSQDSQSIAETQEDRVKALALAAAQQPFDLVNDPLIRLSLLKLSELEHVLLLTLHHIVTDGWSMDVLLRELVTIYRSMTEYGQISSSQPTSPILPMLPIQYADFAVWQRQWLQGEVLDQQLSYWQQQLQDLSVLQLPTDFPRSRVQGFRGAVETFSVPKLVSDRLKSLSQSSGTTLFTVLLTAYKVLLHRYTGQSDIIVGSPVANRHHEQLEELIGFFVNTLVLRSDLSGNPSFHKALQRVRQTTWDAYDHQDLPFEKLVEVLHPDRDLSYNPLFQVKFRLENQPTETFDLPGLTLTTLNRTNPTAKLDLSLDLYETPDGLVGGFEYNTDLFHPDSIQRLVGHFCTILEAIATNPNQPIGLLPLLTPTEQQQMQTWNQTLRPFDSSQCFHHLFEAQAETTPDAIALIYQDQQITYRDLNHRANQLAHYLQTLGAQPETIIGICIDRTPAMIIALLAILKSGAAYLPLDPAYPSDRLNYMLTDSRATLLLTTTQDLPQDLLTPSSPSPSSNFLDPSSKLQAQVLTLDTLQSILDTQPTTNPTPSLTPENLAYLIYTSGSTGKPKGVLIPHAGLTNLTHDKIRVCQVQPDSCVLQFFSLSFDASVPEIVMALASGAKLCLAPRPDLIPGSSLLNLLQQQAITHITITPSALSALPAADLPKLKMVLVGGEAPTPDLITRWSQNRLFINAYGPTEVTVNASMVACGDRHSLQPTLRPSTNKQLHILDGNLQPVPIGVVGELHISGTGLARGYHNRPDLTAEKFIPNPFISQESISPSLIEDGAAKSHHPQSNLDYSSNTNPQSTSPRFYKTGDLATYLPDGRIKILGRIDDQVKIRGFRIEPGEIEMLLTQHPDIQAAAVIVDDNITENNSSDKRLLAYFVPTATGDTDPQTYRRFLKQRLPEYMIPSFFICLDQLPLTANGKIDRAALPAPNQQRSPQTIVPPSTPIEAQLLEIFKSILQLDSISVTDDFFDLGGHSLLATRLITRSLDVFQIELTVGDLFAAPTISELASRITAKTLCDVSVDGEREEVEL